MPDIQLALLIDRLMRQIHFGLQAKAPGFDTADVGAGGGIILLTIAEMGSPALHALTRRVARDKSQMTRMIRSLESKGLVRKSASDSDARVHHVSLTAAGATVVQELQEAVAGTIDDILAPLSAADKQRLTAILTHALVDPD